jgi:thimet oligopeptidase
VGILLGAAAGAQDLKTQAPLWSATPDAAGFEKQENDHIAAGQKAIVQLLAVKGPRTVSNTLEPYDEAVRELGTAGFFSGLMQQVHPDAGFRDKATAMTVKIAGVTTEISLNQDVYHALQAIDLSGADAATRYYVKRTLLEYRLAGVDKDAATRAKIKKVQDELAEDSSMYDRNISDDTRSIEADASELEGVPKDFLDAHKPGPDGKIKLTTNYPDYFPVMDFAKSDALRRRFYETFSQRAYPKNLEVLKKLLEEHYEIAQAVGYKSAAAFDAADKMAQTDGAVAKFIGELDAATKPIAEREYAMLLAEKRKTDPNATEVFDYENRYYSELVRRSEFNFDSQSVRPYFPYERVKKGVLDTAAALFHLTFRQEPNVPGWAPTVETWDVLADGKPIGRFYLDMHPREGKYKHAEMAPVLQGIRGKQLPEAALICNLPLPTADDAGLMDYDDVVTFFHEFGHLMHHILGGQQQWAGISGITMEGDFVEAPSQMLEEWMHDPHVLAKFALHYKTNEPIPAELVERMDRASAYGRASWVQRQTAYSAISFDVYKDPPAEVDPGEVVMRAYKTHTLLASIPADASSFAAFGHLAGYGSAYYTYMWDKVIAEDFFAQFHPEDLTGGPTAMRYRHTVLEPGGSVSANDLVKNFLGRPQNTAAFEKWMGMEFAKGD